MPSTDVIIANVWIFKDTTTFHSIIPVNFGILNFKKLKMLLNQPFCFL
ncbi:hypothetical protein CMALT394_620003 [Carnobacterium maltaromaticum]|nr:hypothetical protein CMALT394_620003 [Carnobacterium maltaromaticum]